MILVMSSEFFVKNLKDDKKMIEESMIYRWDSQLTEEAAGVPMWSTRYLTPPQEITNADYSDPRYADTAYYNYLMSNRKAMTTVSIMAHLIKTNHILIILSNGEIATEWLYSFLEFFKDRYGIAYRDIKDLEDIPDIPEDTDTFSIQGLWNYSVDARFVKDYMESMWDEEPALKMIFEKNLNKKAAEL